MLAPASRKGCSSPGNGLNRFLGLHPSLIQSQLSKKTLRAGLLQAVKPQADPLGSRYNITKKLVQSIRWQHS